MKNNPFPIEDDLVALFKKRWCGKPYKHLIKQMYMDTVIWGTVDLNFYIKQFTTIDNEQAKLKHNRKFNKRLNTLLQ
jgi:hypothetical protein